MARLVGRAYMMVAFWLCATVTVSAELCKDHLQECSFYAQDCDFMGLLCPRTCGLCLGTSKSQNSFLLNVDDSKRDEIPGTNRGLPVEGRPIARTARALPVLDGKSSIPGSLPVGNPAWHQPPLGGDPSAAEEVQLIVADASTHLDNLLDDDSLKDEPESSGGSVPTEQYKPLSYMDVINYNKPIRGEFSSDQEDESGYNFVYVEGGVNFDDRGTSNNDPLDLRLLDIDYLRKSGLLGEEIQERNAKSHSTVTFEERKMAEFVVDLYKNLEGSSRVFNVSDPLGESTDKFIKFYEAESSPSFSDFLYRLFTKKPSTGSCDDYFTGSEEQVADFIDAIVNFDVHNLKRLV